MRKLQQRDGIFAEYGRLNKAGKLALMILDALDGEVTDKLLEALPTQSAEWWASLARDCGVHPPSAATIEATVGLLAQNTQRKQECFDHPDDPLEGLPTP